MKYLKIFTVSFLILAVSGCNTISLVETEKCTILSNSAFCTDKRLPKDQQEYELHLEQHTGYQCTNIRDNELLYNDIDEKLKELAKNDLEEDVFGLYWHIHEVDGE